MSLGSFSSAGTLPSILLLLLITSFLTHISPVEPSVSTFRVYNEKRILDRLASAPRVPMSSFSQRSGELPPEPQPEVLKTEETPKKRRKRIRKVIRKKKQRTTTTTEDPTLVGVNYQGTTPLNNYNQRDIEVYDRPKKRRRPHQPKESSDLQRAESANPFVVNSSAPISTDFAEDGGGLQFQLQILHPLLNQDSILSHYEPKIPENKTVKILHELSDEVAGDVPVAPDLKKLRKKQPLHNPDSIISGETQVAKTGSHQGRRREKISSKIQQSQNDTGVTFVEPYNGRPLSTSFPPITSQTVPVTRPRARTTTAIPTTTTSRATTPRPTIRLTNPPPTVSDPIENTTKLVQTPKVVMTVPSPFTATTVPYESTQDTGVPQVIIFPPEEEGVRQTTPGIRSNTPISQEQDILNQLFGLGGQLTPPPLTTPSPLSTNTNFFDIFNLFQSTTPVSTTSIATPKPSPVYPPKAVLPTTKPRRTTTTTDGKQPPVTEPTVKPIQSQAELDNLLQLALLEGLLQGQGTQGNGKPGETDLSSLLSLLGTSNPESRPTLPPPPTTRGTSLQAALNNMLSVLTNPFNQGSNSQRQPTTTSSIFGGNGLFGGGNSGGNLFGSGNSLFSGNQNTNTGLFGRNSIFNLTPGASSTRTTIVPKPTTTPGPTVSENELLAQILQLGIEADQQQRQTAHTPTKEVQGPSSPEQQDNIQSVLKGNWPGKAPTPSQPSETMQLLNILFNNQKQETRPSGPYWWLDMNAFMGQDPNNQDPMAGIRPKLGQREYFIKVRR